MILTLLSHQWRSFWRSRNAGSSLALQIVVGLIVAYLLAMILTLGIAFHFILKKSFPGQDTVRIFYGFILYYYAFDVVMRFTLQELPVLSTQPYLGQNIPKRQLAGFLNIRSLFHFLNLMPLLLFLPFAFMDIARSAGAVGAAAFVISIIFLTIFNNFFILYIKRRTIVSSWWLAGFFMAIVAFIVLDYFHVLSLQQWSAAGFGWLLSKPLLVLVPIALGLAAWFNNYRFLRNNLYLDEGVKAEKEKTSREYTWLQQLGMSGELIALDIKLILRNKRPKYILRLCALFMAYGFIFYTKDNLANPRMTVFLFAAIFITGIFIMNYGQFLFAWHSNAFDGLMSSNISIPAWIRSKFMLYTAVSTILFIITSLYGLISWKLLVIQLTAWLYNIGVNSVISIYLATYSYKAIDLSKSATFNYQGTGTVQWVYSMILILAPYLFFYPLARWVNPWVGYGVIGGLGLISLLLQNWWVGILTREFHKRKYLMLAGFREK
jgi:hypothetical protein